MIENLKQATDEMYSLFLRAWQEESPAIVGYVPKVMYENNVERDIPDTTRFFCRVSRKVSLEEQATLATHIGEPSKRRYTAYGIIFIQIFGPRSNTQLLMQMQELATVAKNAFRGKQTENGIWFRNVTITNTYPDANLERYVVKAEFEYDEIG